MQHKRLLGILLFFALIGSTVFGSFSVNSRQGSEPIFSITHQGIKLLNPAPDPGSEGAKTKNHVRLNNLAKVLTPYLFTGRKFDTTTQTYFNRWRQYNPKAGRFLSSDPIGFNGGNNLFAYANLNPLRWLDPWGFEPWSTGQYKWTWNEWFHHPTTSDQDRICGDKVYSQPVIFYWLAAGRSTAIGAAKRGFYYAKKGAERVKDWWSKKSDKKSFREQMSPEEAARYDKYWTDHAPNQSSPYNTYRRYTPDGDIKQVTTYDKYGSRQTQFDLIDSRRGPHRHDFRYEQSGSRPNYGIRDRNHTPLEFLPGY